MKFLRALIKSVSVVVLLSGCSSTPSENAIKKIEVRLVEKYNADLPSSGSQQRAISADLDQDSKDRYSGSVTLDNGKKLPAAVIGNDSDFIWKVGIP